jgi:hypothetical protein
MDILNNGQPYRVHVWPFGQRAIVVKGATRCVRVFASLKRSLPPARKSMGKISCLFCGFSRVSKRIRNQGRTNGFDVVRDFRNRFKICAVACGMNSLRTGLAEFLSTSDSN